MRRKTMLWLVAMLLTLTGQAAAALTLSEEVVLIDPAIGLYKVILEYTNEGEQVLDLGMPTVRLLGKGGQELQNGNSRPLPQALSPGESAYYGVAFIDLSPEDLAAIDRYEVELAPTPAEAPGRPSFPVELISKLDELSEEADIQAQATKDSDESFERLNVLWLLRNAEGALIDVTTMTANLGGALEPGATADVWYTYGWLAPSLPYLLEKGLADGSVTVMAFPREP